MLSREDNELVCRVGPGTPMGALMRRYWIPALFSSELAEPDCPPIRIRLLGEDLIAFRASDGTVGLVDQHCPHRGASLFFGRNEEGGLRCVYHGRKFDTSGGCVDMPNEPPESNFKGKIKLKAYPCVERAGLVWAYLGPDDAQPPLPELEWASVPDEQRYISVRVQQCNWLQSLEGAIDASHSNFLHSSLKTYGDRGQRGSVFGAMNSGDHYRARDPHPHFETLAHDHGVLVAARRNAGQETYYWRINHFLMPFYTIFPPTGDDPPCSGHIWVPIDDQRALAWHFTYHPSRPLSEPELQRMRFGRDGLEGFHSALDRYLPPTSEPYGAWRPDRHRGNEYLRDYEAQRTTSFFGVNAGWAQDSAVQESMGAIYDRTREHLGTSDIGIIGVRRYLQRAVRTHAEGGVVAPGAADPSGYFVRPAALLLPSGAKWNEAARDSLTARPGESFVVV